MRLLSGIGSRLRQARFDRAEFAGSLGDVGTFVPLLVGMAATNGLDFAASLFFAGLFNVLTGLAFSIPLAVQPMKAIAAVALTERLTVAEISAAGATVSAVILAAGLTGWIDRLDRLVPRPVVRGLQLALGLSLALKGWKMIAETHAVFAADGALTAGACAAVVLALSTSRALPPALAVFAVGLILAAGSHPEAVAAIGWRLTLPNWSPPGPTDFVTTFPKAALPQIPLTALNSVIAVAALSADLFPDRPASPRRIAVSVGLMNLLAFGFGAMPMCHGAGGLAGQYRFGARTNGSILMLGSVMMLLAIGFGGTWMALCAAYPASVLGVLLGFAGLELALVCRDQTDRDDAFVMLFTATACLGLGSVAVGFGLGWAVARFRPRPSPRR